MANLMIIDEAGSLVAIERDPIRLACLGALTFIRTGRATDKDRWPDLAWRQEWPVRRTQGGGFERVLPVYLKIVGDDGSIIQRPPDGAILIAEMPLSWAKLCGIAGGEDGAILYEKLWIACKWFVNAAGALRFHKMLPVWMTDIAERRFSRADGDSVYSEITWIKPYKEDDWKYVLASYALFGIGPKPTNRTVLSELIGNDVHPVWEFTRKIILQGITSWGKLPDGRNGEEEITKLKAELVNYLRNRADECYLVRAARLARAFRSYGTGNAVSAILSGFGEAWLPEALDPNKAEEVEKQQHLKEARRLLEIAWLCSRGDFLARVARLRFARKDDSRTIAEEAFKAYINGEISAREFVAFYTAISVLYGDRSVT